MRECMNDMNDSPLSSCSSYFSDDGVESEASSCSDMTVASSKYRVYSSPFSKGHLTTSKPTVWEAVCDPPLELSAMTPFSHRERDSNIALSEGLTGETWTYRETRNLTVSIASYLRSDMAMNSSQRVFLCLVPSARSLLSYLAVIKTGAIPVVCNPGYTDEELKHTLQLIEPSFVVAPETLCGRISDLYAQQQERRLPRFITTDVVSLQTSTFPSLWELGSRSSETPTRDVFEGDAPVDWCKTAMMAFSSGTSGLPKAVEISHKALVSLFLMGRPMGFLDLTKQERVCIPIPTYHVGGLGFWLAAAIKGDHCIFCPMSPFSYETFTRICIEWKCERSILVPALVQGLLKKGLAEQIGKAGYLTNIMIAAAPLGSWLQEQAEAAFGAPTLQAYGMTETAGGCIRTVPKYQTKLGSIGQLAAGVLARLIDENGEDLYTLDSAGELLLKCDSLMSGYYRNPTATMQTIDSDGWLHTGDQARIDSKTGNVFIIDRLKELIKYNGYQVAPAELEAVLISHEEVLEAAVVARKDALTLEETPCAFVVAKGEQNLTLGNELHGMMAQKLSSYKRLRGGILFVAALPKTGSNKISRSVLHSWCRDFDCVRDAENNTFVEYPRPN